MSMQRCEDFRPAGLRLCEMLLHIIHVDIQSVCRSLARWAFVLALAHRDSRVAQHKITLIAVTCLETKHSNEPLRSFMFLVVQNRCNAWSVLGQRRVFGLRPIGEPAE